MSSESTDINQFNQSPVALITGGAKRLGAAIAKALHAAGYNTVIHYRSSKVEAEALAENLNAVRPASCLIHRTDLGKDKELKALIDYMNIGIGRCDVLINNASTYYPTPVGKATIEQWDDLMASNLKAPFFLSQGLLPKLSAQNGSIINMVDINSDKPLAEHSIYCCAKAACKMLTLSLAKDLAPAVRVNGVSPGAVLWPENDYSEEDKQKRLSKIPLSRLGGAPAICKAVLYLLDKENYLTGEIIKVDGGLSLV